MVKLDMSGMSDDDRERFDELKNREASGEMNDMDREELNNLRITYGITED
jgi:hypothetical protein